MEELYRDAVILVTPMRSAKGLRWRSSSEVKYLNDGREAVEYLKIDLDYDTAKEAQRAGLMFAKKRVDLNFETGRGKRSRLQPSARDGQTLLGMSRHFVSVPDMLALDPGEIMRIRSALMEARSPIA